MNKRLKNNLIFIAATVLFRFLNHLPRRLALFIGEFTGLIAHLALKKERRRALTNLDRAFGDEMTFREKRQVARDCFITFGRSSVEAMRMHRHYRSQILPNIEVLGEDRLREIYGRGKGIIVFTGHLGNFELLAAWTAQSGHKTAVIGRELYDQRLDRLLVANRTGLGIVNVRTDDSPRTILRLLRDGYIIGFLIDTDSFRVGGELTPFFNRLAKTPIGPTQLGFLAGAAFLPIFCLSLPGGKYRILVGEELVPASRERTRKNIYYTTCRMTAVIEATIRRYPEQWIWMHNRWHTRPEPGDRDFLASPKNGPGQA